MTECVFKEGQRVYDLVWGWGTVAEVAELEDRYPVEVDFDGGCKDWFTIEGCPDDDGARTLFFAEPPAHTPEMLTPSTPARKKYKAGVLLKLRSGKWVEVVSDEGGGTILVQGETRQVNVSIHELSGKTAVQA